MASTNYERREVARRLRKLASENQGTLRSMRKMQEVMTQAQRITGTMHLPSVAHVLGISQASVAGSLRRVASGRYEEIGGI